MKVTTLLFLLVPFAAAHAGESPIPPDGELRRIATGFVFTEGPVWSPDGALVFSDVPANKMYRWRPGEGAKVFRDPSGYANGNAFDAQGRLVTCQHNRRITRTAPDGTVVTLADRYEDKRLNSPNDLVIGADGSIWFTDPTYGLTGSGPEPAPEEQSARGVYRLATDGTLTRVVSTLEMPNGLAFSPDGTKLYVTDSATGDIYVAPADGKGKPVLFAKQSVPPGAAPLADGLKVDRAGNLYAVSREGISIYSPEGGHLGSIQIPERASNLAWGDADGKTLYITATKSVYAIKTRIGR